MSLKKKVLLGLTGLLGLVVLGGGGFVFASASAYDSSMSKVYEVASPRFEAVTDPTVIARGQHLAESIGACLDCHGQDLGGKLMADMGPVGTMYTPNITTGGIGAKYSDADLARLLRNGIKRDGTSVVFMPSADFRWWPDTDITAIISWWRTMPAVTRESRTPEVGLLGKVLDRQDMLPIDVARRIDHEGPRAEAPPPEPTAQYGAFLGKLCQGCHGPELSGGPIPGAPPEMPIPTNLTSHATGLETWTEDDFFKVLNEGIRPDGRKLDPMMPVETLKNMNETEKRALWLYLRSVTPKAFGGR